MKTLSAIAMIMAITVILYLPASLYAQDTLPTPEMAQMLGRNVTTPAIEVMLDTEIGEHFYTAQTYAGDYIATSSDETQPIQISVINDGSELIQHFWVTTDGYNWRPYALSAGQGLTVKSNRSGIVGVFNGTSVRILNARGQYLASTLFANRSITMITDEE